MAKKLFTFNKPDFAAKAKFMAKNHEASAFTDVETLERWIFSELEEAWNRACLFSEEKCEQIAIKKGWLKDES